MDPATENSGNAGPSGTTVGGLQLADHQSSSDNVGAQASPTKKSKGKRKRVSLYCSPTPYCPNVSRLQTEVAPEIEVDMLSQTSFHAQPRCASSMISRLRTALTPISPSLYVKGHQFNFAKSADNQAIARKRAEESDALRREEKRRLVDGLLAQQNGRIQRAGGTPWKVAESGAEPGVDADDENTTQPLIQPGEQEEESKPTGSSTSALETRMPEQEEAEFAQKLEAVLEDFPPRDPETGQVVAVPVSLSRDSVHALRLTLSFGSGCKR
jgi:hypothetical protein